MQRPQTRFGQTAVWGARIAAILLPAMATAYVSYQQARADAQQTKDEAESGYQVLVGAVEKLSEKLAEQEKELAYLQGKFDQLTVIESVATPEPEPPPAPLSDLKPLPETVLKRKLPRSLDGAYQMQQDKAIDF